MSIVEVSHSGNHFVLVPGNIVESTTGWNPQNIHIITRTDHIDENYRTSDLGEPITALRCNDTFAIASTAGGHIKIVNLATGKEVLESEDILTDGGSAFDCCFDAKETLICFVTKDGRVGIASFNNDMATPAVKLISNCKVSNSKLCCVTISEDGKMAACADKNGNFVYVVSVGEEKVIRTFTRGWLKYANILALRFSVDGKFLALNSDHGTYHLFGISGDIPNYKGHMNYEWSNSNSNLSGQKGITKCAISVGGNSDGSYSFVALDSDLNNVSARIYVLDKVLTFSSTDTMKLNT